MGLLATERRFLALIELEAREARAIFASLVGLEVLVIMGMAWWASHTGVPISLGAMEAVGIAGLTQLALIPVAADVLAAGDQRSAQRALASLPVSSTLVLAARGAALALGSAALFLVPLFAWWLLSHAAPGPSATPVAATDGAWSLIAAVVRAGFPLLPLASLAATALVAIVFRHALSAAIAGLGVTIAFSALLLDPGLVDRGESLFQLDGPVHSVATSPWTLTVLMLTLFTAFRVRGRASRSSLGRGLRTALVLALSSGAALGYAQLNQWQRLRFDFEDPGAFTANWPVIDPDGRFAVLTLDRDGARAAWTVDLESGVAERTDGATLYALVKDPRLSFGRGLERQRTAVTEGPDPGDESRWHRVCEERWTSNLGGPALTVTAQHVISPRRRAPHLAYYVDIEHWFHRVDLRDGTDAKTDIQIDGEPRSANVDEDGRWLLWSDRHSSERGALHAVHLGTGERLCHVPKTKAHRIYAAHFPASLDGAPVLSSKAPTGPSHFTIRGDALVPLPLARRYLRLEDVDGERLIGYGEDGCVYLLGADCEETRVLRAAAASQRNRQTP